MKLVITYGFFFLLALVMVSCNDKKSLPSLKETFSKKDKAPFGSYVFYDQVGLLFDRNVVNVEKEKFELVWQKISDTASVYISVSKNLFLTEADKKAMLNYVEAGNSLFISSSYIDSALLDTLDCGVSRPSPFNVSIANVKNTSVKMDTAVYSGEGSYGYYYLPFSSYFKTYDSISTIVLGKNELGRPNFIEVFYGKGRFYLHCDPRAFSNYFLLQKENYQYLQNIFAFTAVTPEHVYWDDYYNKRNYAPNGAEGKSGLSILLQYPSMAWAFWLLLLLLVIYILFGGKRRQRIVQTIAPNTNTTVAFTETIGQLYLQKKDNRNIADKMITYFQEFIRKQYFLNTSQVNDDFISTLSRKGNVSKASTETLFTLINEIQQQEQISDEQLLLLNQHIQNFYKNKL